MQQDVSRHEDAQGDDHHTSENAMLRFITSDEELEAAAQEIVMSYTYQTSGSRRCCR